MSVKDRAILAAHRRGYRMTNDGTLLDPFGHPQPFRSDNGNSTFIPKVDEKVLRVPIRVRRFAAYCFFGEELFVPDIVVLSKSEDPLDFSRDSLFLDRTRWAR